MSIVARLFFANDSRRFYWLHASVAIHLFSLVLLSSLIIFYVIVIRVTIATIRSRCVTRSCALHSSGTVPLGPVVPFQCIGFL
jgi:hypothetical protein